MKVMSSVALLVAMMVLLVANMQVTEAACDEKALLNVCEKYLRGGGFPTGECCKVLAEQQPCICGFPDNHDWPGLIKCCGNCHVPFPQCS
ncbi:bifunctional inhibitor/plant lipid transfer protein/seed storage helical domain-containing protein [Tanacetum coccineum]